MKNRLRVLLLIGTAAMMIFIFTAICVFNNTNQTNDNIGGSYETVVELGSKEIQYDLCEIDGVTDSDLKKAKVDFSTVDTSWPGAYSVEIKIGGKTIRGIVKVVDSTSPIIEAKETIQVKSGSVITGSDIIDSIKEISGIAIFEITLDGKAVQLSKDSDGIAIGTIEMIDDVWIRNFPEILCKTKGTYKYVMTAEDQFGNRSEEIPFTIKVE